MGAPDGAAKTDRNLIQIKSSLSRDLDSGTCNSFNNARGLIDTIGTPGTSDAVMNPTARMVIELNISHFRRLLQTEEDPSKRRTIVGLLAEEEARLASLIGDDPEASSGK